MIFFEGKMKKVAEKFGGNKKCSYLCNRLRKVRAFSSAGLEHLPYKQRVGGSNPSTPTKGCFPVVHLLSCREFFLSYFYVSPFWGQRIYGDQIMYQIILLFFLLSLPRLLIPSINFAFSCKLEEKIFSSFIVG